MSGKIATGEMQLNLPDLNTRYFINEITKLEFNIELPVRFCVDANQVVSTEQQDVNGS